MSKPSIVVPRRMRGPLLLASIALVLLTGNATAKSEEATDSDNALQVVRVYGGKEVEPGEFPFLVLVNNVCGGSIIDEHHVLTAAHCVEEYISPATGEYLKPLDDLWVKVGAHNRNIWDDGEFFTIETLKIHEKYHHHIDNQAPVFDIAILKTKKPMPLGDGTQQRGAVGSINLPRGSTPDYVEGETLTVAGWGYYEVSADGIHKSPTVPHKANLPVVPLEDCGLDEDIDDDSMKICAGYEDGRADACRGDSGGPLFRQADRDFELIGIVSYGPKCGASQSGYGFYTRVAKLVDWIEANRSSV